MVGAMPLQQYELTTDYAMTSLDNLFVCLWRVHTRVEGIEKFVKHVAALAPQHAAGIGLITIVPPKAVPPELGVRDHLARMFSDSPNVKGSAICFEGTGLRATIVRSVVTGLTIISQPAFPHKVFASLVEGVTFVNQHLGAAGAPTLQNARVVSELEAWRASLTR